jgi:tRNA dimethylallyltransferase
MSASMSRAARPVALLMGPTGAGKTDVALELAQRLPVDIVSVDSAMVYRGMDIGTGKPDAATLRRVPHRLVDILDPSQAYSAGQFVRDAERAIEDIHAQGRLPLLVGGTMLYFRALRRGIAEMPSANPQIRAQIDAEASRRGWPALHAELATFDARAAARIRPNDAQRIQRAIEVYRVTGKSLSELHDSAAPPRADLQHHAFAWVPGDRAELYDRIERRFHAMMRAGLLEEVRRLYERGDLHIDLPSIRSVGYRQLWEHLQGQVALDSAIERAILATRHLARRQLVWLRADSDVRWIDTLESGAGAQIERAVAALCAGATTPY